MLIEYCLDPSGSANVVRDQLIHAEEPGYGQKTRKLTVSHAISICHRQLSNSREYVQSRKQTTAVCRSFQSENTVPSVAAEEE